MPQVLSLLLFTVVIYFYQFSVKHMSLDFYLNMAKVEDKDALYAFPYNNLCYAEPATDYFHDFLMMTGIELRAIKVQMA